MTTTRLSEYEITRLIATDRDEPEACEAGTPGCAISHERELRRYGQQFSCEGW